MPDIPIPSSLQVAFDRWDRDTRPTQHAIAWDLPTWRKWLGDDHADLLDVLPQKLDRADVARYAHDAAQSEEAAVRAFVVSMIWGYGKVGFGPFRTRRILQHNPRSAERLLEVARLAQSGVWPEAFAEAGKPGLKYLNRAFGTKFLYFCSLNAPDDTSIAPILDRVVAQWFRANTSFKPRDTGWNLSEYRRYVDLLGCWATSLGVRVDTIEHLIFDSMWNPPTAPEIPTSEIIPLLAHLELLVGELDPGVAEECSSHIDEIRRLCDENDPDDAPD